MISEPIRLRSHFEAVGISKNHSCKFSQFNCLQKILIIKVILAGAPTKMCKLQNLIKQKFPDARQLNTQSPDEIIALGCARQCGLITSRKLKKPITNEDLSFNCLSKSIYLKVKLIDVSLRNKIFRLLLTVVKI